jgi:putative redox protein
MTVKRATISFEGPGLRFLAATDSGHSLACDDEAGDTAPRPMEAVLAALGSCAAMDTLSILRKKRQPVTRYQVRVEGDQRAQAPRVFTSIRIVHELDGHEVDRAAARRAIELTAMRHCSVGAMLAAGTARISHWYLLRGSVPADDEIAEVITIGPGADVGPGKDVGPGADVSMREVAPTS